MLTDEGPFHSRGNDRAPLSVVLDFSLAPGEWVWQSHCFERTVMMAGHFITVLMSTVWGHGQDRVFVYVCARVGAWGEGKTDELSGVGKSRWRRFRGRNCSLRVGAGAVV